MKNNKSLIRDIKQITEIPCAVVDEIIKVKDAMIIIDRAYDNLNVMFSEGDMEIDEYLENLRRIEDTRRERVELSKEFMNYVFNSEMYKN